VLGSVASAIRSRVQRPHHDCEWANEDDDAVSRERSTECGRITSFDVGLAVEPVQLPQAIGHLATKCQEPCSRKRRDERTRTRNARTVLPRRGFSAGLGISAVGFCELPACLLPRCGSSVHLCLILVRCTMNSYVVVSVSTFRYDRASLFGRTVWSCDLTWRCFSASSRRFRAQC